MNIFARASLLLTVSFSMIACATGSSPNEDSITQEAFVARLPRVYVGPQDSCAAGLERFGGLCYRPCAIAGAAAGTISAVESRCTACPAGAHPIGNGMCRFDAARGGDSTPRLAYDRGAGQPVTCAADLESINGSCYRPCPSGFVSQGILGCFFDPTGTASQSNTTSSGSSPAPEPTTEQPPAQDSNIGSPGYDCLLRGGTWTGLTCQTRFTNVSGTNPGDPTGAFGQQTLNEATCRVTGTCPTGATPSVYGDTSGPGSNSTNFVPTGDCPYPSAPTCFRP